MAKRTPPPEEPPRKRHPLRLGCLVVIGVLTMVIVGTVFAPERPHQVAQPTASPSPEPTFPLAETVFVAFTPELTATVTVDFTEAPSVLPAAETASAEPSPTQIRLSASPGAATSTRIPSATRTTVPSQTPSRSATSSLILATNTPPALLIVTNTPASSGG